MIKEVKVPRSPWRVLVGVLCIPLCLWALLPPLVNGIVNVGVYVPLGVGLVGMIWGFSRPNKKGKKGWRRVVTVMLVVLVAAVGILAVTITGFMTVAAIRKPGEEPTTLVVLGAKINGEYPSLMLRQRLDAAVRYLNAHPDAPCVVSGGQGPDEWISEAEAMQRALVQLGIDEMRISPEDKSTSTHENLTFSKAYIPQGASVVIVTSKFHIYRACHLAKECGYESVSGLGADNVRWLNPTNYLRECMAVFKDVVLK